MSLDERVAAIIKALFMLSEAELFRPKPRKSSATPKPGVRLRRGDAYGRLERRTRERVGTNTKDVLRARRERKQRGNRHAKKGTVDDPVEKKKDGRK